MSYLFSMAPSCQGPALQILKHPWGSWQANSAAGWMQALRCVSFPCQHSWLNKVIYLFSWSWLNSVFNLFILLTVCKKYPGAKCHHQVFASTELQALCSCKMPPLMYFSTVAWTRKRNVCFDLSLIQVKAGWGLVDVRLQISQEPALNRH